MMDWESSLSLELGQGPKHWVVHKLKEKLMTLSYSVQPSISKHHSLLAYKQEFIADCSGG